MRPAARVLPVMLLMACDHCDERVPTVTTPSPTLTAVEIVPRTVHAAPQSRFTLPARIKGKNGSSLALDAFDNLEIEWWASADVLVNPASNPVTVQLPSTPTTVVEVRATVRRLSSGGSSVLQQIQSPLAKIVVAPKATSPPSSDWVHVDHTSGELPRAVVIEGRDVSSGDAVEDWVLGVVGQARLERNLEAPNGGELGLFAVDVEMKLHPPPTPAPWTAAYEEIDATGAGPVLFRELPVRVGLDVDPGNGAAWAEDQVNAAFELLAGTRVGIGAYWRGAFVHKRQDANGDPLPVADPAAACSTANVQAAITPYSITDPADPALYVLIVPSIASSGIRGWTCTPESNWSGRVVFLSRAGYGLTTLAHEVGHVLAMMYPDIETGQGHTNAVAGFDWSNLMWSFSSELNRARRDHLSVGQLYRMNADPQSWLNRLLPAGLQMLRDCQVTKDPGVCPALAADLEK